MKEQVVMSTKELERVPTIEKVLQGELTNQEGAEQIGVSKRHFRRLKNKYKEYGAKGLRHKSRGRPGNHTINQEAKRAAIRIIEGRYLDFGPTLAHEKLVESKEISFSRETLRTEMIRAGIWKPKKRKEAQIYQLREGREQEGELIQVDGSPHAWFEDRAEECSLLVYIDDATGKLQWLEFVESETTEAYFEATRKYLLLHGKPLALYTDKHSVFRVNTKRADSASTEDSNGETQFGRAMRELGVELIPANTPQAKGRVERANQTLQDRLVKELRLRGISSMEDGNRYLSEFIREFNERFSVKPKSEIDAHRPLLKGDKLDNIFCLKQTRVLSKNLTMQYKNKTYQIRVKPGYEYTLRRVKAEVIEKIEGEVIVKYRNKELEFSVIEVRPQSEEFNSKIVNRKVEEIKRRQGKVLQFNLLGGTFLFCRKPDISIWG